MKLHSLIRSMAFAVCIAPSAPVIADGYVTHLLVSDTEGTADFTDPNLLNPWGLATNPNGELIVADNHSNMVTFYRRDGRPKSFSIDADEEPTALVINHNHHDFILRNGRGRGTSEMLFASESGTILGWNSEVTRDKTVVVVDNSDSGAVYKGLAIGNVRHRRFLYAADFHNARIDVFDTSFHLKGSFTDPTVDAGFAPFNIHNIDGNLWVTFALQKGPDDPDDQSGPGNGFVDVFDTRGNMLQRFASHGTLNSPWGMARAPGNFGEFSNALLVGNFGDGRISAFDFDTGDFLGQLADDAGAPLELEGLWALSFGRHWWPNGEAIDEDDNIGRTSVLYFTAAPNDEEDGMLGYILAP